MSRAIPSLETVKVLDPRVDLSYKRKYAVYKGGTQVTFQQFSAPSVQTSSFTITANPPNPQTIVNRKIYQRWNPSFAFTGTGNPLLQLGLRDGLRANPIATATRALTVQLNNISVTTQLNNYVQPFLHYHNGVLQQDYDLSMSPSMLDQFQDYNDWVTLGSGRNPLAFYGEDPAQINRGGFVYDSVVNGNGSATVNCTLTEPVFLSPMTFGLGEFIGFVGLQTMSFQYQTGYGSMGLECMWSHAAAGNAISSTVVSFLTVPQILMNFISPDPIEAVPPMISYPYYTILPYSQPSSAVASGASTTVNLNTIQLENIPSKMYIWARERQVDADITTSDVFAEIQSVMITFNNKSGVLAGATSQDLYQIALKNGYNGSYPQWRNYQGSVLAIDPSADIGLQSDEADGVNGSRNLVVQVTFRNPSAETRTYELWVGIVTEGVFTIANQQCVSSTSVLTPRDVLEAKSQPGFNYSEVQRLQRIAGGSGNFFSDVSHFLKKGAKTLAPVAKALLPIATGVAVPVIRKALGAGDGGALIGGVRRRKRRGGALLSRQDMADRLEYDE